MTHRNEHIDILRAVGALGIVQFHTKMPGGWIGLSALPLFVMLVVYFGVDRPLSSHARRLLVPWLFWSIVYFSAKVAQSLIQAKPIAMEFAPWMVLTGPSIHLWFLPFSFLFLMICRAGLAQLPKPWLWVLGLIVGAAALWLHSQADLPRPFAQWVSVLPAALTGLLMSRARVPAFPALGLFVVCAIMIALGGQTPFWQLGIASLAVGLALCFPAKPTALSKQLNGLSYGVYLVHPIFVALSLFIFPIGSVELFATVLVASVGLTVVLRRHLPWAV